MYNKKLLERFIDAYSYSRKLMEFDIKELVKKEDFFMIAYRAAAWKKYNILVCELNRISEELNGGKSINDMMYVYNDQGKMYREDILNILKKIRESN